MLETKTNVLIVDDSITMRKIIKTNLEKFNIIDCDEALDGNTAWQMLNNKFYDVVFIDYNMPGMNGLELAKKITTGLNKLANMRIVAVSSAFSKELIMQFKAVGVRTFVAKPFGSEMFKAAIGPVLAYGLEIHRSAPIPMMSDLDELFHESTPKVTFDGKFVLCEFTNKTLAVDAEAFMKASRIYTN